MATTKNGFPYATGQTSVTTRPDLDKQLADKLETELYQNPQPIPLANGFTGKIYARKIGNILEIFGTINATSNHVAAKHVFTLPSQYVPHPSLSIGDWQTVGVITGSKGMINALVLDMRSKNVVISRSHGNGLAPKNGEEITLNSCKILLSN